MNGHWLDARIACRKADIRCSSGPVVLGVRGVAAQSRRGLNKALIGCQSLDLSIGCCAQTPRASQQRLKLQSEKGDARCGEATRQQTSERDPVLEGHLAKFKLC